MTAAQRVLFVSAATAVGTYVVATVAELAFIRGFRPTESELTWISDVILAATVGVVTYLWQHLRATRATLTSVERKKLVLDTQLSLAADLQRSLLPLLPERDGGLEWAADLVPAGRVGGDFYDYMTLPDGTAVFIVGDISGKGIPAAMLLAYARAVFRIVASETPDPAEVVGRLARAVHADTGGTPYLTCIVGRIDTGQTLRYVNAGHPPGIVLRDGRHHLLDIGGPPAGLLRDAGYLEGRVGLQPGDLLVIVTDGVTEALNAEDGPAFDQMSAFVRRQGPAASAGNVTSSLVEWAGTGAGPADVDDWQDDRTAFAVRVQSLPLRVVEERG